ncbi:hypothetical protein H6763_00215 [Candidatus Nomurabacteria bacterium]|nr:hypothetical protein [Candidatus Nomurabacteria bacterium]
MYRDHLELMEIGVNSKVFYPSHGAGQIVKEKKIEFAGETKRYFEFSFLNKKLTISTPVQNIGKLGIRTVLPIEDILQQIKLLKKKPALDPQTKDYNELMNKIQELDQKGEVASFVEIIQYANFEKIYRNNEGRLIPVSITKFIKSSVEHIVSEMAVSQGISYDDAAKQFTATTGLETV